MVIANLAKEDAACRKKLIAEGNEEAAEIDKKIKEVEGKLTGQGIEFVALLPFELWDQIAGRYLFRFRNLGLVWENQVDIAPRNFLGYLSAVVILISVGIVAWLAGFVSPNISWYLLALSPLGMVAGTTITKWGADYLYLEKEQQIRLFVKMIGILLIIVSIVALLSLFPLLIKYFIDIGIIKKNNTGLALLLFSVTLISIIDLALMMICIVGTVELHITLARLWIRILPQKILVRCIWPRGIDQSNFGDYREKVSVHFRHNDIQWMRDKFKELDKMHFRLCIVAENEAIIPGIPKKGADVCEGSPLIMVYTSHCNWEVVAIHAQIGEFACKKEVMKWAKKKGVFCSYLKKVE